jgi:uncharacterized membrane protein
MPLQWLQDDDEAPDPSGASCSSGIPPCEPDARLVLWPHRSLDPRGFVWFISLTAVLLAVPLVPLLGTPVLWGLLPFLLGALAMVWFALRRSWQDRTIHEILTMGRSRIHLARHEPHRPARTWQANPHWVSVHLHAKGGPVDNYVTLRGGGREVEIGAFLSEDERLELWQQLQTALTRLRHDPTGV